MNEINEILGEIYWKVIEAIQYLEEGNYKKVHEILTEILELSELH